MARHEFHFSTCKLQVERFETTVYRRMDVSIHNRFKENFIYAMLENVIKTLDHLGLCTTLLNINTGPKQYGI